MALGLVPDWQFSADPRVNPNINPFVNIPQGWRSQSNPAQNGFPSVAGPNVTNLGYQIVSPPVGFVFNSWVWEHRKKLVVGGLILAAGVVTAGLTSILK